MKVSFFQRLGAYILDTIIIGVIASIICFSLPSTDSSIEETINELNEKYIAGEITLNEFYSEYNSLLYENQKDTIVSTGVSLILTFGYFVIFQYMNKGQTLGKKLFELRVVDKDTNKSPTILNGLIRSLIVLGIASTTILLILINLVDKKIYLPCYFAISIIETIFVIITIIFVLCRKDGRGLHDIMAKTTVIKEGR